MSPANNQHQSLSLTELVLLSQFRAFLFAQQLSNKSIKNYVSDVRRFLAFWKSRVQEDAQDAENLFLTQQAQDDDQTENEKESNIPDVQSFRVHDTEYWIAQYRSHLLSSATPLSTLNRHLASLKQFAAYLETMHHIAISGSSFERITFGVSTAEEKATKSPNEEALEQFGLALAHEGCSSSTIRNYLADTHQFMLFFNSTNLFEHQIKPPVGEYLASLRQSGAADATIRQKRAAIKKFFTWAKASHYIKKSPFDTFFSAALDSTIQAVKKVAKRFVPLAFFERSRALQAHTQKTDEHVELELRTLHPLARLYQKYTDWPASSYVHLAILVLFVVMLGIFGYRQFFLDAEQKYAYPSSLTVPNRILSFQGRVTDSSQTPIVIPTSMKFRLFNHLTNGTGDGQALWASGTCSIDPDQDGIFSTLLGSDCGGAIPASVFSENQNVFLEVEVSGETLGPRQQIATVGYALNSETLQGFPASASAVENTVLIMNNSGDVILGSASPNLKATSNSTFTVEGTSLALITSANTGGDITIQPDSSLAGSGSVNFVGGTDVADFIDINGGANLTTGTLIKGSVGNNNTGYKFLSFYGGSSPDEKYRVDAIGNVMQKGYLEAPGATLSANYAGAKPLVIRANSGQTANITEWVGTGGSVVSYVAASGALTLPSNGLTVGTNQLVASSGNIGIGSTAPNYQLDVVSGDAIAASFDGRVIGGNAVNTNEFVTLGQLATGGTQYWQRPANTGIVAPTNITDSVLVGGIATTSAIVRLPGTTNQNAFFNLGTGNVGIGSTTPGAKLHIADTTDLQLRLETGSGNYWNLGRNESTGHFQIEEDSFGVAIDISNSNGNVGIGSTTPLQKLDVAGGNIRMDDTQALGWGVLDTYVSGSSAADYINFRTAGGDRMRLNDTGLSIGSSYVATDSPSDGLIVQGNVGIGTTTANTTLHVLGNQIIATADGGLRFTGTDGLTNNIELRYDDAATSLSIRDNANTVNRVTFLQSGNVGIGVTNPDTKTEIFDSTSITSFTGDNTQGLRITGGTYTNSEYSLLGFSQSGGAFTGRNLAQVGAQFTASGSYLHFGTSGTYTSGITNTAMSINPSGNVGIGSTAPSQLFNVNGGTGIVAQFSGRVIGGNAVNTDEFVTLGQLATGGTQYWQRPANTGIVAPTNITDDVLTGAIATTSAIVKLPGLTNQNAFFNLGTGNLGVGTTNPNSKLHVRATSFGEGRGIWLGTSSTGGYTGLAIDLSADVGGYTTFQAIKNSGASPIYGDAVFNPNGGNVGIGITNPTAKLHVNGNSLLGGYATVSASLSVGYTSTTAGVGHGVFSGNVGIGTTTLTAGRLTVVQPTTLVTYGSELTTNGGFTSDLSGWTVGGGGTGWTYSGGTALHGTGNTDTLYQGISVTNGTRYQVTVVTTGVSAGTITMTFGSYDGSHAIGSSTTTTKTFTATATETANITFTPTSTFNGAIDSVSITAITAGSPAALALQNADYSTGLEMRSGGTQYNTFVGVNAGQYATSLMSYSVGIGRNALQNNTTGIYNTSVGALSMTANTNGYYNAAFGMQALNSNTNGNHNVAVGRAAMYTNTSGSNNTAVGGSSLYYNTTGGNNSAFGYNALNANTTASYNTAFGNSALASNQTGSFGTAVGYSALNVNTGGYNTALGYAAGAYNTTGTSNVLLGLGAGYGTNGSATFSNSVVIGRDAGSVLTSGGNNILIGYSAGSTLTSGANNILIGYDIEPQSITGSNQLSIGNLIFGSGIDGTGTTVSSGNIGVGTTTPAQKFHVNGGTGIVAQFSGRVIGGNAVNTDEFVTLGQLATGGTQYWQRPANTGIVAPTNITDSVLVGGIATTSAIVRLPGTTNQNAFFNLGTGNVGIGLTNPTRKLTIVGGSAGQGVIRIDDVVTDATAKSSKYVTGHYTNTEEEAALIAGETTSSNNFVHIGGGYDTQNAATAVRFYTAANSTTVTGTERMRIDSTGNVGIGLTNPANALSIYDNVGTGGNILLETTGVGYMTSGYIAKSITDTRGRGLFMVSAGAEANASWFAGVPYGGAGFQIGMSSNHATTDGGNDTGPFIKSNAKLFINTNGNVGIGTTTVSHKLSVYGNIGLNDGSYFGGGISQAGYTSFLTSGAAAQGVQMGALVVSSAYTNTAPTNGAYIQGNTGIGITNPTSALQVAGATGITVGLDAATNTAGTIKLMGVGANDYYTTFTTGTQTANATYTLPTAMAGGTGYVLTGDASGVMSWTAPTAVGVKWNALTNPDGNLTLAMANYATVFNWDTITSQTGISFASAATGFTGTLGQFTLTGDNAANTGTVLKASSTGTSSTGTVAMVTNLGAGSAFRVNDETGDADTTPFIIDAAGNVGIGLTNPAYQLQTTGQTQLASSYATGTGQAVRIGRINGSNSWCGNGSYGCGLLIDENYSTLTGAQGYYGAFVNTVHSGAGNPVFMNAGHFESSSTTSIQQLEGFAGVTKLNATATLTGNMRGGYFEVGSDAAGGSTLSIANAYGVWARTGFDSDATANVTTLKSIFIDNSEIDAGTIGTYYGVHVSDTHSGGTITTGYGMYLSNISATNDWGIYQAGSDDYNYFAGNVGIGTTAPATPLQIVSTTTPQLRIDNDTAYVEFSISSAGALTIDPTANADVIIAHDLRVSGGGISDLEDDILISLDNTNNNVEFIGTGNVGVGTANPTAKLHVNGNSLLGGYATVSASLAVGYDGITAGIGNASFSGLVGVGTSSPTSPLHLYRNYSNADGNLNLGTMYFNRGTASSTTKYTDKGLLISASSSHAGTYTGGIETNEELFGFQSTVTHSGAMSNNHQKIIYGGDISVTDSGSNTSTATTYGLRISAVGNTGGTSKTYGLYVDAQSADTNYGLYVNSGLNYLNGNLGIGTTNPLFALDIEQNVSGLLYAGVNNTNTGTTAQSRLTTISDNSSSGFLSTYGSGVTGTGFGVTMANYSLLASQGDSSNGLIVGTLTTDPIIFGTDTTERMRILSGGNVGIGITNPGTALHVYTTSDANNATIQDSDGTCTLNPESGGSWSCTSDQRLKTNIRSITATEGLQTILALRPARFNMISNGDENTGFIAQEVQQVIPDAVSTTPDGYLSVAEGKMIPYIVGAIQEQQLDIASTRAALNGIIVTDVGHLSIQQQPSGAYALINTQTQTPIETIAAFGDAIIANIEAGTIKAQELVTSALHTTNAVVDNVLSARDVAVTNTLTAPIAEIDELHTNLLRPNVATSSVALALQPDSLQILNTNDPQNPIVLADIDANGNATFSGMLQAETIQTDEIVAESTRTQTLEAANAQLADAQIEQATMNTATISGTLYADRITAQTIDGLNDTVEEVVARAIADAKLAQQAEDAAAAATTTESTENTPSSGSTATQLAPPSQQLLASLLPANDASVEEILAQMNTSLQTTVTIEELQTPKAIIIESFLVVPQLASIQNAVINQATIGSASVQTLAATTSITISNQLNLSENSIELLGNNTLYIQPQGNGSLNLLAGAMILSSDGTIQLTGDVTVHGSFTADTTTTNALTLRPSPITNTATDSAQPATQPGSLAQLLQVYDEQGKQVAGIDASGSATLASVNTNQMSTRLVTIAAPANNETTPIMDSVVTSNATAGSATITAPNSMITIQTPYVTEQSLIYVTPTSQTNNQVLYVANKTICNADDQTCTPSFTVAVHDPTTENITFNWWIVKLETQNQ